MSLSVNGIGGNLSMLNQLQKMQQQMRSLQMASAGTNDNLHERIENSPVYKPVEKEAVPTDDVNRVDNVSAFASMLKDAFENVNTLQNVASNQQTKFDLGDRSVTLSDVVLASQKASIAFDATVQVRNRMVEAYRTISQMQV